MEHTELEARAKARALRERVRLVKLAGTNRYLARSRTAEPGAYFELDVSPWGPHSLQLRFLRVPGSLQARDGLEDEAGEGEARTMKLYELTDAYRSVLEELSEASGDGEDEARCHDLLDGLAGAFDEKVLSIAKIIRSIDADVTVLAAEVERLQGRKRHLAGRIDWLKRYLLSEMEAVARDKVSGPTLTVCLAKAPSSCDVVNVDDVPKEFRRVKVEIDRSRILEHFRQTGEVVPGTTVALDRRYVRIS